VTLEGAPAAGAGSASFAGSADSAGLAGSAGMLEEGAAARIADSAGERVTAGPDGAEILVWEMHSGIR
jgi:hypothetical protein